MGSPSRRALRTRVYFRVAKLKVEQPFTVGNVTFRPVGWLRRRLQVDIARRQPPMPQSAIDSALQGLEGWEYATADVTIPVVPGDTADPVEAQEQVRDAIAAARLYQRACLGPNGSDHQTFGLAPDIGATLDWHWKTDRNGIAGFGGSWVGVLGDWTFSAASIHAFRDRPAFAFLDDALRTPDGKRVDWQRRAVTAVRTLNFASPMLRQPIRIVLQAVALEALLGDDPSPPGQQNRPGQAHRIAQRAAFLTCRDDRDMTHGPSRPACFYLVLSSDRAVRAECAARAKRGEAVICSAYWRIRELVDARDAALHEAQDHFPDGSARNNEGWLGQVILAALDWVAHTQAQGIVNLTTAIEGLPKPNARLDDTESVRPRDPA